MTLGSLPYGGDDHRAFDEDAQPRDLTVQFGTRRFNSSKKFSTTINSPASLTP